MKAFVLPAALLLVGCHSTPKDPPSAETLENGRQLFTQHCQQCHPNGKAGLGPALNNKPAPSFLVKRQIRWGLGAMPSFKKEEIPESDLKDLVTYVIALRKEGTKPMPK
jgi:mono/diheme cytochrome c family protein